MPVNFYKLKSFNLFMVRTIAIADDVYEELVKMKGNKSFSELLRELIGERKGNLDVILKLVRVVDADKLEKVSEKIEEDFEKWKEFLTRA